MAIQTVNWQSLLCLEPLSLKNTRSFTQRIAVLMTVSLNQNSVRRNTLHLPPASTLRMRTAILLFPTLASRTKEQLFVAATAAVTWLRTCVIYIYHPWKTVESVLSQEKISNVSLLTLLHVSYYFQSGFSSEKGPLKDKKLFIKFIKLYIKRNLIRLNKLNKTKSV